MSQHKCYLVVGEVEYESHDFSYAKIFLNKHKINNKRLNNTANLK